MRSPSQRTEALAHIAGRLHSVRWILISEFLLRGCPPKRHPMTTEEIQQYIAAAIRLNFDGFTTESGEMMTSAGGDGRFLGKVIATMYCGLPGGRDIYLVIGQTEKGTQIIKFGDSECLKPSETELDLLLLKELGIEIESPDADGL